MEEQTTTEPTAANDDAYKVKLENFEGPLDLLLHLIKKNELEIEEVPISVITEQYLEYIEMLKSLNLEVAGEYLVMAATLAHIKSKKLLPEDSVEEIIEEDDTDPEEELRRRLIEYQRFKEAGEELREREWLGRDVFTRDEKLVPQTSDELKPVSLFTLVELFYERLKKIPTVLAHEVTLERVSIAERIQQLVGDLEKMDDNTMDFTDLIGGAKTRYDLIVTFLAVLEMVRVNFIRISQIDVFSPILVSKRNVENNQSVNLEATGYDQ